MRIVAAMAVAGLLLVAVLGAVIWAGQRRAMYFPFGGTPSLAGTGLEGAEAVALATEDGLTLGAWFVPAKGPVRFTAIVFNGNAGHRGHRADLAAALARDGVAVLLMDYRGFGGNGGAPSEEGLAIDARAARAYLLSREDADASRILYFGESLGTAVATRLAAEHAPAALILRSPFVSMSEVGRFHYPFLPVGWLLRDRYDAAAAIRRVTSPVLVIAGDRDAIIPIAHSRRLFEAANEPKTFVVMPGADHNDFALLAGKPMMDAIAAFLSALPPERGR
jgi:fermentation-respiration switch protein FrsA (DUF1100 family)